MKQSLCVFTALVVLVGVSALAADRAPARDLSSSDQGGAPLVRLMIDPVTGRVEQAPAQSRGVINPSFSYNPVVDAVCHDCGACPALPRWVTVTLHVQAPVCNFLIGNYTSPNATKVSVDAVTKGPLGPGDTYVVDFHVNVIDCGNTFGIWFDVCSPPDPAGNTANPCP